MEIEKVDDFTVRLNGKVANLSIPESLFHYPFLIMDPNENGEFKVGSNGAGAFDMVELDVGKRARFVSRKSGHWGGGARLDASRSSTSATIRQHRFRRWFRSR